MTSAQVASLTGVYLLHTCTIRRAAATGYDAYEEPTHGDPADVPGLVSVDCWCWQPRGTGEVEEPARALVAHTWHLMLPAGSAVYEHDQVANVRNEAAVTIVAGPLDVIEVAERRGHVLVVAQQATSGEAP